MSIVAAYRRTVKSIVHPLTPTSRPTRPFAEGITIEPTPVNRVSTFLPEANPAAPVKQWTERQWRRAEDFKLRIPTGMVRPTAIKAPAPIVAPVVVESPTPVVVPAPTVKPSSKAKLDAAWHSGYCLGADGVDAAPRNDWPADVRTAFADGLAWGSQQRDADLEATAATYAELETAEMPSYFAACYA